MAYNQLYHECFLGIMLKVRENIALDVDATVRVYIIEIGF